MATVVGMAADGVSVQDGVRYYLIPMSNIGVGGCTPGVQLITKYGRGEAHNWISMPEIRHYLDSGSGGNDLGTVTPLVVPDGTATVTARYPAQTHPGRVPRPVTITKTVINNLVIFVFRGAWDPPSLTYHSRTGATIRPYLNR